MIRKESSTNAESFSRFRELSVKCGRDTMEYPNGECWTGALFEPYQYVAILIVDSVHSVIRVNEDGLRIQTKGVVIGKSAAVEAPRGVGAELRLIE